MLETKFRPWRAVLALTCVLTAFVPARARADSFTLQWDANTEAELAGYYVFIGTAPGVYSSVIDVGRVTSYTHSSAVSGATYYVTVAAYAAGALLGPRAPEVRTTTAGAPLLTNPGNRSSTRGVSLTLALQATDPNGDVLVYSALGLPPGLAVNPTTGVITGTPTTTGTFNVSVTVADTSAKISTQFFTWTIETLDAAPPAVFIKSPTTAATYATSAAFVTLSGVASDDTGLATVTWANDRGGSGTVAGTANWSVIVPVQTGTNVLTVTATDVRAKTSRATLTVTAAAPNAPPAIRVAAPTAAASYVTKNGTLSVQGVASDDVAVSRVTWTNDRGGSGTATGTTRWQVPTIVLKSGNNLLTFTARDGAGKTTSVTLLVTYAP